MPESVDLSRWWGPLELQEDIEDPAPELRCLFCQQFPLPGERVFGIADLIFHWDPDFCHPRWGEVW